MTTYGEFTSVGESLKRHWSSHDVEINAGVSEEQLTLFEGEFGVVLPQDLRGYFLCVNGMPPEVVDDGMIRFWTLGEVKPLRQAAPDYSDSRYIKSPESVFLFSDYSMWAHAYAIRLGRIPMEHNEVVIIGYKSPMRVANSFSNFVNAYLTDKDLLH